MGDRAYAGAPKPVPVRATNGTANGGGGSGPPRPAPPSMLPGGRVPPPPMYRPKPAQSRPPPRRPRRSARGWCCACCLWLTLVLVGLVFLGAIAAGVFYVVYHPQPPSFAVTSLRLAALNVSDSDALTSRIDFTVTARNPNDKIAFAYGDIAASFSADGADVGAGTVPGFVHPAGNTTVIRGAASASAATIEPVQVVLRSMARLPWPEGQGRLASPWPEGRARPVSPRPDGRARLALLLRRHGRMSSSPRAIALSPWLEVGARPVSTQCLIKCM